MNNSPKLVAALAVVAFCLCLRGNGATQMPEPHLYMAGDSIMADYKSDMFPQYGWGQSLKAFMKNPSCLHNLARSGWSARRFRESGRWEKHVASKLKPGDWVIVSFGHNDMNKRRNKPPKNDCSTPDEYKAFLRGFAADVRAKGANIAFATSIVHSSGFDESNGVMRVNGGATGLGTYVAAMREVAAELGAPLLDLNKYAEDNLPKMGMDAAKALYMSVKPGEYANYPKGKDDAAHVRDRGAFFYAKAAVEMARSQGLSLAGLWKDPATVPFVPSVAPSCVATATESVVEMPTYPFSDPDPVPAVAERRYPYFRYDGSTAQSEPKAWKTVVLENENISVTMMPEIGGKVWGAHDKKTGVDFIYHNHVVKFRDIAMRGPWCSGGIEFNFGIIGHAPSSATPVDWLVRTNHDGSVSCFAASAEYITRSRWQVEVRLAPGAEAFETRSTWFNSSGLPQPYYHWMNAAFSLHGNPRFLFPGASYIGHEGDVHDWPRDAEGHELDVYRGNAFGRAKSYHVLPGDGGTYAIWWPERDVGAVHRSVSWEKYGRKIWLWALSREGGIWEDLLTDKDGQYTELQSGRCFNQPHGTNYLTPFKHPVFCPGSTERFTESWGVLRGTNEFAKCADVPVKRPDTAPAAFDWTSAWGQCVRGEQYLRDRCDAKAEECFKEALKIDAYLSPALFGLASIELRRGEYAACHELCRKALAVDAYDSGANYLDGFAFFVEGDCLSARDRLGVAAFDPRYRSAAYALIARSYLREGKMDEADNAAALALSANDANLDALLVRLVAARGTPQAERMAKDILDSYPLFHAARFELEGEGFMRYVRNEFPHQTCLELGSWYEESGLCDDARKFFLLAGANRPIARIRAAYLTKDASALSAVAALPADGVFPFRRESLPALRWAAKAHDSWKFKYYFAVALASFHLDSEADAILAACGNVPDEAVFYMVRAARRSGKERLADLERAKSLWDSWRVGLALCRHYDSGKDYAGKLAVAKEYVARFPGNNPLQLAYADALVKNRLFKEAMEFLKGVTILPSENSNNATGIWHEAQKGLGLELTYPENLGRGKPYPEEKKK